MSELEQYIRSYFGVVNQNEVNTLVSLFTAKTIKKGDFLLKSGKICTTLNFVQSGLLRLYVNTECKEITQWISKKGQFSTDLSSFIFENSSSLNIQAIVDTEIYTITKESTRKNVYSTLF
jgi:CRP/FNR family transcriptional regulator, anaerobic regulatory protein